MSAVVVFDLDGTLIDSAADIQAAANAMLGDFGGGAITRAQTISFIGRGAGTFTALALQAAGLDVDYDAAQTRFRERYAAQGAALAAPYPGAVAALRTLAGAGGRLGLCTNKPQSVALEILDAMDLARWFEVVVGAGADHPLKPDPAGLRHCFAALGAKTGLYVGDSETDARTTQAAGCRFALYTEGYRHGPVEAMAPDFVFDDFAKLPGYALTR